ncbi:predicted protein [Plenodomus lingam JN3]|uniref:Predicted protein n=2 Tax=Leptosphaeria maculans TaxID=5022 RepID=E4ZZY4_LEPMJ|nr:predicted protein [Plenodomus lingam JN3]CBX96844.1 predicted protein [Plenodomus lingam JN3]
MRPQREIARDWCLHSPILLLSSVLFPQLPGLPVPEQELADKYGVVISTSHHEPMQRAMNEWFDEPYYGPEQSWSWIRNKEKISKYFVQGAQRATRFEGVITIGMRGDGDREMDGENPQELLEEVLSTQRRIIKDVYGREDAVPQVIALYKEVQEYYENGLAIPEDVTLLFANDNFGTIRRLPTDTERTRRGGAGLYHHLEFGISSFTARTFGAELAAPSTDLLLKYDRLIALRKHEHIAPETFSLINYSEADNILSSWQALLNDAEMLYTRVLPGLRPSFFQLILHPIRASHIYVSLQICRAKNALYAKQRGNTANHFFDKSISLFKADFQLSQEYHTLLNGKWNHIMRQPLILDSAGQESNPIVGNIGVAVEGTEGVRPGVCNEESDRTHPSRRDLVPGVTLPVMEPYGPKSR